MPAFLKHSEVRDLAPWSAGQPETVTCAWCAQTDTPWSFTGTHAECVAEAAEHRQAVHNVKRTRPKATVLRGVNGTPAPERDSHGLNAVDRRSIAERTERVAPRPRGYWTLDRVVDAYIEHERRYGRPPTSSDWAHQTFEHPGYHIVTRLVNGGWPELRGAVHNALVAREG